MHQKFEWILYLALAKELLVFDSPAQELNTNENIKEAYYRTVISRAYYAAFCTARNYLRDALNIKIRKEDAHAFVISEFKEQRKLKNSHSIANSLYSLRNSRNMADYDDIAKSRLDGVAHHAIKESQRVIDLISTL